jgi:hypothetical protein
VVAKVKASQHIQDYFANDDFVGELRGKEVDILWTRAPRDVDSVHMFATVRNTSHLTNSGSGASLEPAIYARQAALNEMLASAHIS